MILSSVLTFARTQVQTNSDGLTDENGVVFANEALIDFRRRLANKRVDAGGIHEASITGTAGTGIYSYPTNPCSIIALKTIEVNYANTDADNYKVADQVDVSNLPDGISFGWLRTNASTNNPKFDDRGEQFEIFPTPTSAHNVTNIIKLFGYVKPSVFGTTTDTVQFPENQGADILGWRVAGNYLTSLNKEEEAAYCYQKYEERVNQYVNTLGKGSQQPIKATPIQLTGYEF